MQAPPPGAESRGTEGIALGERPDGIPLFILGFQIGAELEKGASGHTEVAIDETFGLDIGFDGMHQRGQATNAWLVDVGAGASEKRGGLLTLG